MSSERLNQTVVLQARLESLGNFIVEAVINDLVELRHGRGQTLTVSDDKQITFLEIVLLRIDLQGLPHRVVGNLHVSPAK